jgi:acetylornithine deacetylase/succinyl-diaminopimelate desuccinylase family protein
LACIVAARLGFTNINRTAVGYVYFTSMTLPSALQRSLSILKSLIEIESVNPTLVAGGAGERRIAEYLLSVLQAEGIVVELEKVCADRFNVVARVHGVSPGPRLLLNGHLDTVSVEGMAAPFKALEKEGKIFGRGALDMKAGVAAATAALIAIHEHRQSYRGEIVLAAVVDEEDLSLGTQHFLKNWSGECPFDFALVTEPTNLRVCSAHKGFAWLEVSTEGVAAHGSRPQEGVDAIRAMGKVLQELELLDEHLQAGPAHALLGTGSLHASLIQGGREWSSYPDRCVLKYERRTVPGESDGVVEGEMSAILGKLRQSDARFRGQGRFVFSRAPLEVDRGEPNVRRFFDTAQSCLRDQIEWGAASFWTDAALLSEAGIPAAVFGPRGEGLHSLEEYVIAGDVVACAEVIYRFAMGGEAA